jgi:hypothetical protein
VGATRRIARVAARVALAVTSGGWAFPADAAAQAPAPEPRLWIGAGVGAGYLSNEVDNDAGLALNAHVAYQRGAHLITARGGMLAEIFGDELTEVGLLYGRGTTDEATHASISAGMAWVHLDECPDGLFGSGSCDSASVLGVPIVAEVAWRPARIFGVGLQGFANLNDQSTFYGAALIVEVGRLR